MVYIRFTARIVNFSRTRNVGVFTARIALFIQVMRLYMWQLVVISHISGL